MYTRFGFSTRPRDPFRPTKRAAARGQREGSFYAMSRFINVSVYELARTSGTIIKHLMTGHKGSSEFCYPETLNVPRGEAEGKIEVEEKQNSLFPEGPVIKCFLIPPDSKIEKAPKKVICLRPLHTLAALAKLSGCQNQPVVSKSHDNSLFLRS